MGGLAGVHALIHSALRPTINISAMHNDTAFLHPLPLTSGKPHDDLPCNPLYNAQPSFAANSIHLHNTTSELSWSNSDKHIPVPDSNIDAYPQKTFDEKSL